LNSCSDSDGGKIFDVKGTVSGMYKGGQFSFTDSCLQVGKKTYVKEYYCKKNVYKSVKKKCVCVDGACTVSTTTTTSSTSTTQTTLATPELCREGGGTWSQFPYEGAFCHDECDKPPHLICKTMFSMGCDCGVGRCWSGSRCVPDPTTTTMSTTTSTTLPVVDCGNVLAGSFCANREFDCNIRCVIAEKTIVAGMVSANCNPSGAGNEVCCLCDQSTKRCNEMEPQALYVCRPDDGSGNPRQNCENYCASAGPSYYLERYKEMDCVEGRSPLDACCRCVQSPPDFCKQYGTGYVCVPGDGGGTPPSELCAMYCRGSSVYGARLNDCNMTTQTQTDACCRCST